MYRNGCCSTVGASFEVDRVGRFMADVDLNHPMAGKTLTFDVEIVSVRAGDASEVAHGHVHEEGAHAH